MTTDIPADPSALVCNLDTRGARTRARVGAVGAIVTIVIAAVVVLRDVSPWWALAAFPSAYGAALGFLQSKART